MTAAPMNNHEATEESSLTGASLGSGWFGKDAASVGGAASAIAPSASVVLVAVDVGSTVAVDSIVGVSEGTGVAVCV